MTTNNPNMTETVGTICAASMMFNGQAQTAGYSPEEAASLMPGRGPVDPAQNWNQMQDRQILNQDGGAI